MTGLTKILSDQECKQKVGKVGSLQMCSSGNHCINDPGGPLWIVFNHTTVQVGVLSFIEGEDYANALK